MLNLVLLAFALVCFCLAAFPISAPYHPRLIAAGLAFWVAADIFGHGLTLYGSNVR